MKIFKSKTDYFNFSHLLILTLLFASCDVLPDSGDSQPEEEEVVIVDYENGLFVSKEGDDNNQGTFESPFYSILKAAQTALEGQKIYVHQGTYDEFLYLNSSISSGISIIAYPFDDVLLTNNNSLSAYVIRIQIPGVTINGFNVDGNWRTADIIKLDSESDNTVLKNLEVYNTKKDCIDIDSPKNITIDRCKIYNALWFDNGRRDSHGIVTAGVQELTISNSEIYYVSGDALQFQYNSWDNILVENCKLWNGKLPEAVAGFPKGVNPGENAIDTKYRIEDGRGRLTVSNVEAYGWRSDYISNAAAFNIKHNVEVLFDGITVYDSEIAFRLRGLVDRGNALVDLTNAVIFDVDYGVRYEDNITDLHVFNCTFGKDINSYFVSAGGHGDGFLVQNCLFFSVKPSEASHSSNISDNSNFIDSANNNYQLSSTSPAINGGIEIDSVKNDRLDKSRTADSAYDCGAYEYMD